MPVAKLRQNTVNALLYAGRGNEQCIFWDEKLPCFGVRIFPTDRRSYVCSYRIQGRFRIATLGRTDILTLDQARKKARRFLGQAADGVDPQAATASMSASGTIKVLCEEYLRRHAKEKKRSWKNDQGHVNRYLIPKLGARLVGSITTADIARVHSEVGAKYPYAANRLLEVVSKMFTLARTWGTLARDAVNPVAGIVSFPEKKRRRYVTTAEMPRLAAAIDADDNEYARHAIWLLILTGLRRSELQHAKWADVDWDRRTLYIRQTKNGEPVLAPLSHAAIARLKSVPRIDGNPHIICGNLNGKCLENLKSPWSRIVKMAGLEDLRIHDLRRTVGSWLVHDGASLHLVGEVLNHKDCKTTAGYAYFQTADRQAALDRHGETVLNLAKHCSQDQLEPAPGSVIAESLPRGRRTQILDVARNELYDLVWSRPVTKLAREFGVSDVGLAKACRRAGIPIPKRGYWARVAAGHPAPKTPLSPCTRDIEERVKINSLLTRRARKSIAEQRTVDFR